jgi:hypothetical protein
LVDVGRVMKLTNDNLWGIWIKHRDLQNLAAHFLDLSQLKFLLKAKQAALS